MITIKKILVPTELSAESVPAVGYATSLARQYQAELMVIHVLATDAVKGQFSHGYGGGLAPGAPADAMPVASIADLFDRKKQIVNAFLEQHIGNSLVRGLTLRPLIRYGAIANELVAAAKEEKCDLIVMAQYASRLRGLFRRSTAERVARQAPCPVLIVQSSAEVTTDQNERVPLRQFERWAA